VTFDSVFCEQSYLLGSHSSLRTDSLGLDLSATPHSGISGLGTGREENVNFLSGLSDDEGSDASRPQVRFAVVSMHLSSVSFHSPY